MFHGIFEINSYKKGTAPITTDIEQFPQFEESM